MVLYHRLEAIALDNMAKKYGFSPFLAKLPPEMTPVTPRWFVYESENY